MEASVKFARPLTDKLLDFDENIANPPKAKNSQWI